MRNAELAQKFNDIGVIMDGAEEVEFANQIIVCRCICLGLQHLCYTRLSPQRAFHHLFESEREWCVSVCARVSEWCVNVCNIRSNISKLIPV